MLLPYTLLILFKTLSAHAFGNHPDAAAPQLHLTLTEYLLNTGPENHLDIGTEHSSLTYLSLLLIPPVTTKSMFLSDPPTKE